jgi:hypothetical protein
MTAPQNLMLSYPGRQASGCLNDEVGEGRDPRLIRVQSQPVPR